MNLDVELSRGEYAIDYLKRSSVPPAEPLGSPAMPQRDPPSFVRRALAGTVITIALGVMSYSIAVVIFTMIAIGPIAVPLVPLMMFHGKRYLPVCILLSGVAVVLAPIATRARLMRAPFVIVNAIAWGFGAVSLGWWRTLCAFLSPRLLRASSLDVEFHSQPSSGLCTAPR